MTTQPISGRTVLDLLSKAIIHALVPVERSNERAELLAAYRVRHRWKASDAARLRTLPLSPVAERRIAKLSGRGRPSVSVHTDVATKVASKVLPLLAGFQPNAQRKTRFAAIKQMPWWPHYVEAVYRGEHEIATSGHFPSAAERTEQMIADALCLSTSTVRKLCGQVRRLRKDDFESANFPTATLAGFMEWIDTGRRDNLLPLDEAKTI
jgi:hypothetical protein